MADYFGTGDYLLCASEVAAMSTEPGEEADQYQTRPFEQAEGLPVPAQQHYPPMPPAPPRASPTSTCNLSTSACNRTALL
jgi:hypothetical protein